MNDNERMLLRAVVDNDTKKAQAYARVILTNITSQRDQQFKADMIRRLETKASFIELPYNLKDLLVAEDVTNYPIGKFLMRDNDETIVNKIIATYRASKRLMDLGISYLPAAIFYGKSGTGKTELAKYIAHKVNLPFIYVRFSSVVNSLLGGTQSNISKIFSYVKNSPCLLCFDEIDAIGLKRGDSHDVSEMSRVTIALMQEMDSLPNNVIIIGTTNRYDRLDPTLIRRFPIGYHVVPLTQQEIISLVDKFFRWAGYEMEYDKVQSWCNESFKVFDISENGVPVYEVVRKCTNFIVGQILLEDNI